MVTILAGKMCLTKGLRLTQGRQRFHQQLPRVVNMRVKTTTVALMMIATILLLPLSTAEAQNDGSTQTIVDSVTWSTNSNLDGSVIVADGGVLTIDSSIQVATGSTITVEEGGSIVLNGAINAAESNNEMYMEVYQNTVLQPYFAGLSDTGTLRVNFASDYFSSMDVYLIVEQINTSWDRSELSRL